MDLALQCLQGQLHQLLCALGLIGVGELFVGDNQIAGVEPEPGEMGVRVDLGRDDAAAADDGPDAGGEVTLEVVVTVSDRRAVQAEHHSIQGQGRGDLAQDDVAKVLLESETICQNRAINYKQRILPADCLCSYVDVLVDLVGGVAKGGEALDQHEAVLCRLGTKLSVKEDQSSAVLGSWIHQRRSIDTQATDGLLVNLTRRRSTGKHALSSVGSSGWVPPGK